MYSTNSCNPIKNASGKLLLYVRETFSTERNFKIYINLPINLSFNAGFDCIKRIFYLQAVVLSEAQKKEKD